MENMEQFQLPEGVKLIEEGFEANLNPTEEGITAVLLSLMLFRSS